MRKAVFRKARRGQAVSKSYSLPAPVQGLNLRDSVAAMSELDALEMTNIFPETSDTRVRRGIENHVTGITGDVESLMVYNSADGTQTMFAAAVDSIYNVTSSGAVGAAVVSSLTNGRFNSVNFTVSGGTSYLCCFNGADSPRYWDGSSWLTITGASTPAITGITTSSIITATVHKRRMWLILNNSMKAYYLPVDSVGGAANYIDLGGIAKKGGYIMAAGTWTIDGGEGVDDLLVFVTSEGEAVAYKGTDPSSSTNWSLVGTWYVGEPIGRRCFAEVEGDLLLIAVGGVLSMSAVFASGRADSKAKITDRINNEIKSLTSLDKANYGWELFYFPQEMMLILNIPVDEGANQIQYAMNTQTGAWGGPFENIEANCWALLNGNPYYGGDQHVGQFWSVDTDLGESIQFDQQQAYSWLGSRGVMKQVKAVKPYILASGSFEILLGVNTDFSRDTTLSAISFTPSTYAAWDSALWDSGVWGSDLSVYADWQNANGIGSAISMRLKGQASGITFRHQAYDMVYENGGVIG